MKAHPEAVQKEISGSHTERTSASLSKPPGWVITTLGELVRVIRGVSYKKEHAKYAPAKDHLSILRATNIGETLSFDRLVYVPQHYVSPEQELRMGDIVLAASSGSRSVVGKTAALKQEWKGSFGAFCFGIRPSDHVNASYLAYFLRTSEYRKRVSQLAAGVNINNLKASHIQQTPVPVAPLTEQSRIVEEIERQFTRLEAAVEAMKRVGTNLKRYRASVLKAACEGRLVPTEAELARAEGRDYEPAEVLLQRTRNERANKGNAMRGRHRSDDSAETARLGTLPDGWVWTSLGELADIQSGIQKQPSRKPVRNAYPFLRVANVLRGRLDLAEIHRVELFGDEISKLRLEPGDLLIVEGNGSRSEIGRMAIWDGKISDCVHQNHIIRARLLGGTLPAYASAYWNAPNGSRCVFDIASSTSGLYTLSVSKVSHIPVPLPPLAEQHRIVNEVGRRLSVIQELQALVAANLKRAERLRQSILKRAFDGKLVPQDPNNESASFLLERIRAERKALHENAASRNGGNRIRKKRS